MSMLTINGSNVGDHVWVDQNGVCEDQVCPAITINELPDEVLLGIFELSMAYPLPSRIHEEDTWHTLVHVCRRWRCVVFDSPHRLDLRLFCLNRRPVNTLDIWPELPIVVYVDDWECHPMPRVTDVTSLNWHNRVCKIVIKNIPNSLLKELAMMTSPFPALITLDLTSFEQGPQILPDSFLGGSVPSLRSFSLWGIPFPAMGKLLLSTRDLVNLSLGFIPPSGFILPDAMVDILFALTKLKSFQLHFARFEPFEFWTHEESQCPPVLKPVVLPAFTNFDYRGNSEYLEGIISRIDAPLDCIAVTFTNQLILSDVPSFRDFICRIKIPNGPHQAVTFFSNIDVEISFFQRKGDVDFKVLNLRIPCSGCTIDSQLSSLAQVCSTLLPPLLSLELLSLYNFDFWPSQWQHEVDHLNTRWMELLRSFVTVKDLVLHEPVVLSVASSLQELVGEQATEILPALQNIFLEGSQ